MRSIPVKKAIIYFLFSFSFSVRVFREVPSRDRVPVKDPGNIEARRETLTLKDPCVLRGIGAGQLGVDRHEGHKGQDGNLQ